MGFSFNLIEERWIPCLHADGRVEELGLRATLAQAQTLREVRGDTPLETAALHRLLLAVLHRVFGPESRAAWLRLWQERMNGLPLPELSAYLAQAYPWFDLFDSERPFFQVANEAELGDLDTINKMMARLTPDATLFEHTLNRMDGGAQLSFAQAARALLAIQNYALGYQLFVEAPCTKGLVFAIQGDTLLETLLLNLVRYPEDSGDYPSTPDDRPAWEQPSAFCIEVDGIPLSRDFTIDIVNGKEKRKYSQQVPLGQLDYLTWHNRKVKLYPEVVDGKPVVRAIRWAPGLRLEPDVLDPMQFYKRSEGAKTGWNALALDPDRALWRDLDVLLRLSDSSGKTRQIVAMEWLGRLCREVPELFPDRYRLSGFAMGNSQAKPVLLRHETMPLPLSLLRDDKLIGTIEDALNLAQRANWTTFRALFVLAYYMRFPTQPDSALDPLQVSKDPDHRDILGERINKGQYPNTKDKDARHAYLLAASWGVERQYWAELEPCFHRLVLALADAPEAAAQEWTQRVHVAAQAAFDRAVSHAGDDRRALRAVALAQVNFHRGLRRALGAARRADEPQDDDTDQTQGDEAHEPDGE